MIHMITAVNIPSSQPTTPTHTPHPTRIHTMHIRSKSKRKTLDEGERWKRIRISVHSTCLRRDIIMVVRSKACEAVTIEVASRARRTTYSLCCLDTP